MSHRLIFSATHKGEPVFWNSNDANNDEPINVERMAAICFPKSVIRQNLFLKSKFEKAFETFDTSELPNYQVVEDGNKCQKMETRLHACRLCKWPCPKNMVSKLQHAWIRHFHDTSLRCNECDFRTKFGVGSLRRHLRSSHSRNLHKSDIVGLDVFKNSLIKVTRSCFPDFTIQALDHYKLKKTSGSRNRKLKLIHRFLNSSFSEVYSNASDEKSNNSELLGRSANSNDHFHQNGASIKEEVDMERGDFEQTEPTTFQILGIRRRSD